MFTVNIKGKANPKNLNLIKIDLVFFNTGYARVTKVLNITGSAKDWDNSTQSFKSKSGDCITKNKNLLDIRLKYQKVAEDWEAEGRVWSPVELSHCFDEQRARTESIKVLSVSQMIDHLIVKFRGKERIKNGQIVNSSNNAKTYERIKRNLEEFCRVQYARSFSTYYFKDISESFLLDYTLYIKKKGIEEGNKGALASKLRRLRAVCNHAKKMEIPNASIEQFDCLGDNIKWDETTSKAISTANIYKIETIDRALFSKKEQLNLDLFLFSYYSGGMANVDVCNLTWDCVQDGRIVYERIKFPKTAKPIINKKAEMIMNKYKGQSYQNYVFPVFTHKHIGTEKKTTRVKQISTTVSQTLSKACRILRIKENVTWYSARGSFISRMVDEGKSPYVVAEMSGNSPMVIYKHYYKNTKVDDLKRDLDKW